MGKWTQYFSVHRKSAQHETVVVACDRFSIERKEKLEEDNLEDRVKAILSLLHPKKRKIPVQRLENEEKSRCEALEVLPKKAVDLGCGTGRDSFYLVQQGFLVLAVDNEPEAREVIRAVSQETGLPEPKFQLESFENLELKEQFDLINASLSLPFAKPENFRAVWTTVVQHIKDNGRFSGHFFGNNHSWSNDPSMTFLTLDECLDLFRSSFEIEFLKIEAKFTSTVSDGQKYWHEFDVVAKKRPESPQPLQFSVPGTQFVGRRTREADLLNRDTKPRDEDYNKTPQYLGLKKGFLNRKRF